MGLNQLLSHGSEIIPCSCQLRHFDVLHNCSCVAVLLQTLSLHVSYLESFLIQKPLQKVVWNIWFLMLHWYVYFVTTTWKKWFAFSFLYVTYRPKIVLNKSICSLYIAFGHWFDNVDSGFWVKGVRRKESGQVKCIEMKNEPS